MNESYAREEICRIGRSLFERGYVHATAGNISLRLDNGILITPSDACLGFLDPARIAQINLNGQQQGGDRASKTLALHQAIYRASRPFLPDTSCIIHTHSTFCVSLSLNSKAAELIPPITPYFVMKVGHVPLIPYGRPGSPAVADQVAESITAYGQSGRILRAVMLARLGPNVWHDSPSAAMGVLEELEETAKLISITGSPIPELAGPDIEELRKTFGAYW